MLTLGALGKLKQYLLCFAILISGFLHSQKEDTIFGRPVVRQSVALKYNIGMFGALVGTEVEGIVAPYNWMHVQCSYRAYSMILSGITKGTAHKEAWDVFVDLRLHLPFRHTFTGFFVGPYHGVGRLNLQYKERLGQYLIKYYDRFEIHRQVIGVIGGFSICPREIPRLVIEFHVGAGQVIQRSIVRTPPEVPMPNHATDHSEAARRDSEYSMRFGFCLGYVFF